MTLARVLEGRCVRLEPLGPEHAGGLLAAAIEPDASYLYTAVPSDGAAAVRYVKAALAQYANGAAVPFAIISRRDGAVVGSTRFVDLAYWPSTAKPNGTSTPSVAEVGGTWLAKRAQRTAVNTETKLLLLEFAFEVWAVERIALKTDARNMQSRTAIERIGAAFEGIRRRHMPAPDGTIRDTAYYSIVAGEWPATKQRLQALLARHRDEGIR